MTRPNLYDPTGEKTEDLKRATREANEALRDIKNVVKEGRRLIAEIKALIEGQVKDLVETAVADHIASLGEATKTAMDESVAKVQSEFNKLSDTMIGAGDERGTLEEIIQKGMCKQHNVHRSLCRKMVHSATD